MAKGFGVKLKERIISQGAEASLIYTGFCGKPALLKLRSRKEYREERLDRQMRRQRTKTEALIMHRAKAAGVRTPLIYEISRKECGITMEFLKGKKLKECLNEKTIWACNEAGRKAACLHNAGIIHGDLTTSNIMLEEKGRREIALIDFGLAFQANGIEDRAVDLIGFKKTYFATHWRYPCGWKEFLKGYNSVSASKGIEEKIREVEARARYV